jgi:hypothetical protein
VTRSPELKQFDTTARTWLAEAGFPKQLGNTLVNTIAKVAEHTAKMTPGHSSASRNTRSSNGSMARR